MNETLQYIIEYDTETYDNETVVSIWLNNSSYTTINITEITKDGVSVIDEWEVIGEYASKHYINTTNEILTFTAMCDEETYATNIEINAIVGHQKVYAVCGNMCLEETYTKDKIDSKLNEVSNPRAIKLVRQESESSLLVYAPENQPTDNVEFEQFKSIFYYVDDVPNRELDEEIVYFAIGERVQYEVKGVKQSDVAGKFITCICYHDGDLDSHLEVPEIKSSITARILESITATETTGTITSLMEYARVGNGLIIDNGVIKVNKNITKVKISLTMTIKSNTANVVSWQPYVKHKSNEAEGYVTVATGRDVCHANDYNTIAIATFDLENISNGDELTIGWFKTGANSITISANNLTQFTIEEVSSHV